MESSWTGSWVPFLGRTSSPSSPGGLEAPPLPPRAGPSSLRERPRGPRLRFLQVRPDVLDDLTERLRGVRIGMLDHKRFARVPTDDDARVERDSTEERQAKLVRRRLASADLENRRLLPAMRAHEAAHVLDHAEDVHLDRLRERNRLPNVQEG